MADSFVHVCKYIHVEMDHLLFCFSLSPVKIFDIAAAKRVTLRSE